MPHKHGGCQHRNEQAAAKREPNREAGDGIRISGIRIGANPQLPANSLHLGMKVWAVRDALERSSIYATVAIRKVHSPL